MTGNWRRRRQQTLLVTGVVETLSYENTITLAKKLYPDARQVVGILDDTVTGEGERKEFQYYDTVFPELDFVEIDASKLSQEELKRQVAALGEESILVYIMCSRVATGMCTRRRKRSRC